jgi:hypothetical protein
LGGSGEGCARKNAFQRCTHFGTIGP